jgi:AcrR family transcriptional regulator
MTPDGPLPETKAARQRSTRDRPAKSPLSVEVVVDAALAILKAEGLEAVSMRRVAAALDTGAASLYVYVDGRDGLHRAMLDRVTKSVALEIPNASCWRDQMHSLLQRIYDALNDYPGLAVLSLANLPTTEPILLVAENLLGILLAGDIDPQDAAWATDIFTMLVTAVSTEDDVRQARGGSDNTYWQVQVDELFKTFTSLPVERFPLISSHATEMVAGNSNDRFHFAIDVVIDGVIARANRH